MASAPESPSPPLRLLAADDHPDILDALTLLFKRAGIQVVTTHSPAGVLTALEAQEFDALLLDMNYARDTTSGHEGLDLISRVREREPFVPVLVMTAWGNVEAAVEALHRGARDYIQKPWDNARLLATVKTQLELGRALRGTRRSAAPSEGALQGPLPPLAHESRAMQRVVQLVERVGPSEANVLITGEHGTGKEVVARWLHGLSKRASHALVSVNAGGLAEGVFESELFGHVKGAFTDAKSARVGSFELAHEGTLFLDEVGNMPLGQQAKLLRALQTGEFHAVGSSHVKHANVRVLSATNVSLPEETQAGRFREDLLYRLNTVEIHLPPLRERREDIAALATRFLAEQAARYGRPAPGLSARALQALLEHAWPGNVRELEHTMERAMLLAQGDTVEVEDLTLKPALRATQAPLPDMTMEQAEHYLITRALSRAGGNVTEAAKALGLSRSALYRRLQHFGLKGSG
ncbi:Two-component system response regulator [Cystobacter fuscus DSM 2262]|uniref:Two-component system response regulator n=1 Tax=Cystobacter fuscus (strain ATCC 25194 / DSM 2262 / NBRC 100088 / M29) TaxID=1242864 RepID=S9P1Q1_CYSF2|nr:sigma-54 dependent transcriptional regulator [Cystobacter fuscus]EPX56182.1 Two-component system response regulator [Cystobacter fuscus DSM 2262]